MRQPTDALAALLVLFEQVMQRLAEGRARRWESALSEVPPRAGAPSPELLRFGSGGSTLDEYLRGKVERALAPLVELLDREDLAFLEEWARERLDDDPVLTALVERIQRSVREHGRDEGEQE